MKINTVLLSTVYSCALLGSFYALASSTTATPGKMAMSGELIETACSIDPNSREISIEFSNVSASMINASEEGNISRPLFIRLTGCSVVKKENGGSFYPYATVTFMGNTTRSDPTALLISGKADGFGIRLRDKNGVAVTIGKPSPGYELSDEDNVLKFTASLVPVNQHIKAGEFYAIANFFMDYN